MDINTNAPFPVELMIDTPRGPVPLTPERGALPLPRGLETEGPLLTYGPYLNALSGFLIEDSCRMLTAALEAHLHRSVTPNCIRRLRVISEKHGALYQVCHILATLEDTECSLAIDTAVRPDQQAALDKEFAVLEELENRFHLPYLPRPYLVGEAVCREGQTAGQPMRLFIAEWFDGYHEFHLAQSSPGAPPVLKVWDSTPGGSFLDPAQSRALYRGAAGILTAYLDETSFRQIYPWHHAAGDFVVRLDGNVPELRLVTARGYLRLAPLEYEPGSIWIGIVHFFLNLTLRLRLDRLEGTRDLAWADGNSLAGIVQGFLHAWEEKAGRSPSLPTAGEVLGTFRSFSPEEWLPLVEAVMEDGLVASEEHPFLVERIEEHVAVLVDTLRQDPA